MKVLVTGGSGLIGRHAAPLLAESGFEVRTFHRGGPLPEIEHFTGDLCDADALRAAARGTEAIVHLAGGGDVAASVDDPVGYARLNATGALHALEAARAAGARFVLASTQRVYRKQPGLCREDDPPAPDTPYGYAKRVAELWCRMEAEQYGVPCRVLRFFSVYGPGQQASGSSGVVTIFARAALQGGPLKVQSAARRDFTDVRDVARSIVLALQAPWAAPYEVLNVATGIGTSFLQLAESVVTAASSRSEIIEALHETAGQDLVADVSRARRVIEYEATIPLGDGLRDYVAWLSAHEPLAV